MTSREKRLTELVDGRESSGEESEGEQKQGTRETRRDNISTDAHFHKTRWYSHGIHRKNSHDEHIVCREIPRVIRYALQHRR